MNNSFQDLVWNVVNWYLNFDEQLFILLKPKCRFCKSGCSIRLCFSVVLRSKMRHPQIQEKMTSFLKKYFLEGQKLEEKQKEAIETLPNDAPFFKKILVKHRRIIGEYNIHFSEQSSMSLNWGVVCCNVLFTGILIPLLFFEFFWWIQVSRNKWNI